MKFRITQVDKINWVRPTSFLLVLLSRAAVSNIRLLTRRSGGSVGTEFLDMISEHEDLLGCSVDLLESQSVPTMENWIKRKSILSCIKTIYAVEV